MNKYIYYIFITVLILSLSGCGKSNKDNQKDFAKSDIVTTEKATEATTTSTTEKISSEVTTEEVTTEAPTTELIQDDWVANLGVASSTSQIIIVSASGNTATLSMHNKDENGKWYELLSSHAYLGKNGIGKSREGDNKTPTGIYHFTSAFGINSDPGCIFPYTQVDSSYYWVDDSSSSYYNQFVSTNNVVCDWNSAEHITEIGYVYNYVLALDYNSACTPGLGSAIFLHCSSGNPTAGCISVPEDTMFSIMQNVRTDCTIIIDDENGVYNY